ncbi:hypothetical protein BLA23254_07352 [Burkholderia lata]|uniref:Uncharacterized protein n=1 Tax=Burkholderia lata (strain ATCC 17760 / DSM 23089 / LMG 22485 / NCIMB 9086 / R18194 / 383) TaxID=482957 RepID=A0A6P2SLL4_BURL3|nr:hypothetical protein [Burkholderia lata]VWC45922.1 hypothetical protein BLA23254_07352 [Burkholderia lata]
MHQALPDQRRARALGLTHRAVSGIGVARFTSVPLPAIFATQRFPASPTATARAQ